MLTTEIKKKLIFFFAIPALIILAVFLIFGVILNHGTIVVTAKPGYQIKLSNGQKIDCAQSECKFKVKPGNHTLTITKPNFQEWVGDVKVGYQATSKLAANLIYEPQLKEILPSQFPRSTHSNLQNEKSQIFIDEIGKNGMYFMTDSKTARQILMVGELDPIQGLEKLNKNPADQTSLKNPVAVASFIREIKTSIFASYDAKKSIVVADLSDSAGHKIYFIDYIAKSRNYLKDYDMVEDMRVLPNDKILILGKHNGQFENVSLLDPTSQQIADLELNTPLQNIVVVNENRLVAITNQSLANMESPENFEGKAVKLGDPQDQYSFIIDYPLDQSQPHLIKAIKGDLLIGLQLNEAKNTLYFRIGLDQKAYQLQFDYDGVE